MSVEEALDFLRINTFKIRGWCTTTSIVELLAKCESEGYLRGDDNAICSNEFLNATTAIKWDKIYFILKAKEEITMEGVRNIFSGSSNSHILKHLKFPTVNQATIASGSSQVVASKPPDDVPVYKLSSDPNKKKGRVLIINNDFWGDKMERKGSEVDVKNLTKFFEDRDFQVETQFNKTKKEVCDSPYGIIPAFIRQINDDPLDSVFVIIMSHGDQGGQIEMIGKEQINLFTDVIQKFTNDQPGLVGKPKIFITQACRGGELDGIVCDPQVVTDARAFKHAKPICPNLSDVLLIFPSLEGYGAFRDTVLGSDLICNLLAAYKEYPNYSLDDQLKMANSKIKLRGKSFINCMEWRHLGFRKFYFNPPPNSNFIQ